MSSTYQDLRVGRARPEIESSWTRSRLSGLREDGTPALRQGPVAGEGALARAAAPVLERAQAELDGTQFALVLADREARIVDIRCSDKSFRRALATLGVVPGVRLGEDQVGTNAVGTPLETRQGLLVRGAEHFMTAFHTFACYGHPIIHPITRRLEGVVNIGGLTGAEHPLFAPLVRRIVRDIEDRLQLDSTRTQRRLLAAFQAAVRSSRRAVMVMGQGVVLATPSALALLEPADHAAVQACAEDTRADGEVNHRLILADGRTVGLRCTPVDGAEGVLVDIVPERLGRRGTDAVDHATGWPLLVVGEPGSGRTTEARRAAGSDAATLDATDAVWQGERDWAKGMAALLEDDGPPVIIENVQLLTEQVTALTARCVRSARRRTVLTSTPGEHLDGVHAPLAALCNARRDLVPLRRRRHEIPRLAQSMLADAVGPGGAKLSADCLRVLAAQSWPGNLAELRRVVQFLAGRRSVGDIIPSDLPASHRGVPAPASPLRQAEREIIIAAIDAAGGNRLQAARALGVSRSTLYNRMRALHIH
ncbi:sigma 54 type regulator [Streptomyces viridiviolaceus]|uniref:Sigma-54-dependent Fis family transcriptional regulator n=1 Tax=Streptomyces viridiviolaceus TaxID=68282 RepID=A0ABW2EC96_9ACTN|nr:helix-turn-helix domain-containing protein [Streptomyces viridiviolaceus]GHB73394.1 sigma 54 type regulator [Streptomyces viridiviolaceus]